MFSAIVIGKDHTVLGDDADLVAEAFQRDIADVGAVDARCGPRPGRTAYAEQREQRGLPAAVAADDGDAFTLGDFQIDRRQRGADVVRG